MAKHKSKLQKKHDLSQKGEGLNVLGTSAKQVGITLASVFVAEIVEAVVERLIQRFAQANSGGRDAQISEGESRDDESGSTWDVQQPIEAAVVKLRENMGEVKPAVQETIASVQSTVSDLSPTLAQVVDLLKEKAQRSLASGEDAGDLGETGPGGIPGAAQHLLNVIKPDAADSPPAKSRKKAKKKGKKKH